MNLIINLLTGLQGVSASSVGANGAPRMPCWIANPEIIFNYRADKSSCYHPPPLTTLPLSPFLSRAPTIQRSHDTAHPSPDEIYSPR